jgi:hypothetical protein
MALPVPTDCRYAIRPASVVMLPVVVMSPLSLRRGGTMTKKSGVWKRGLPLRVAGRDVARERRRAVFR